MNFGQHHYVPVLKVKQNEKKALQSIPQEMRSLIIPLLEIVERKPNKSETVEKHLDTAFKGLVDSVLQYPRCLLDARELKPDGPAAAQQVFKRAKDTGIIFTPVTGISRTSDVDAALMYREYGLALRTNRREIESGSYTENLKYFLQRYDLRMEEIDLVIDLGAVDDLIEEGIIALSQKCLAAIPDHEHWRSFTISACAFPKTMAGISKYSYAFVERAEWKAWRDELFEKRDRLKRLPTFSDCAIQHPAGVEGFDFRTMQVSASIRYTLPEQWLLIKGESTRNKSPKEQFPRLATALVSGELKNYYAGQQHCAGCADIKAAADGNSGYGSAGVWRRIGTTHHITRVIEDLSSLP